MPGDIHRTRVSAAGHQDQSAPPDMHHQRLFVENLGVGLPAAVAPRVVAGHPALEVGGAVDLSGDQHRTVQEQRRLPALDHFEAFRFQGGATQSRHIPMSLARQCDPASAPHQWVDGHRQPTPTPQPSQPGKTAGMIEVAVAEHHDLDRTDVDTQAFDVGRHPVG
jgi:hypothetical protein